MFGPRFTCWCLFLVLQNLLVRVLPQRVSRSISFRMNATRQRRADAVMPQAIHSFDFRLVRLSLGNDESTIELLK